MLLDGCVEETFHRSMLSCTCNYVSVQAVLAIQASWLEPANIIWVVKHVFDGGVSLVNADWKTCQNNPLDYNAIGVSIED